MKKKKGFQITTRNLLILLTVLCIGTISLSATDIVSFTPLKRIASAFVIPFQKGISKIGTKLSETGISLGNIKELNEEVANLKEQVATLQEQNLLLTEDKDELERLRGLYETDKSYSAYEKTEATVISKDAGNWYSNFIINKGSNDGIAVNMNVIADGGLVGLVTEVGTNWAGVQSIIDDQSSVSAMTLNTNDTCIVNGDLRLLQEGKISFEQMKTDNTILEGERIVTSSISDKYLPDILIGTISDISEDSNHLTKTGHIVTQVDFSMLREVLVIKQLKSTVQ